MVGDRQRIFRRPYNYDEPPGPDGTADTGLIFAAYQRDIGRQFLPIQCNLAEADLLNEWITPIGSAVFRDPARLPAGRLDRPGTAGLTAHRRWAVTGVATAGTAASMLSLHAISALAPSRPRPPRHRHASARSARNQRRLAGRGRGPGSLGTAVGGRAK